MGTQEHGVLLKVKRYGPKLIQLQYERAIVTKTYHTKEQAAAAFNAWAAMANGR